ncbi:MAG: GNAT family N-acetyltransferase [Halieaceae bacterium]|nr:GNAT family N-acetyltransferase [Halieaceae bacterium]
MAVTSTLRRAGSQDLQHLLTMIHAFCEVDGHRFEQARIEKALMPLLTDDQYGGVWLIEPQLGYAVITWGYSLESGGREALIDELYVSQRNQGIGQAVIKDIVEIARAADCQVIFLESERHNEAARRFYARQGFVIDDSIWMSRPLS